MGDTLSAGQKLGRGDLLTSGNGAYTLTLQDDGNLVLAARGEAIWAAGTSGEGADRAEVQADGNFVVYAGDTLFNIAKQYLGDGNRYQELAKFNNIANPDHIEVGQTINIP